MSGKHPVFRANDSRKQRLFILIGLVAVAVLLGVGYNYFRGLEDNAYSSEPTTPPDARAVFGTPRLIEYEGMTYEYKSTLQTLLLLGIDKGEERQEVSIPYRSGGQADFIMLVVVDRASNTVDRIQIDRDTITEITVLGVLGNVTSTRQAQICLSHGFGDGAQSSCQYTIQALKNLIGDVDIDNYMAYNMDAINALNEAVGGVTVTIEDDFSQVDPTMTMGSALKLQGSQAETFVRGRMSVGDGTNNSRMRRQRMFLSNLFDLVIDKISADANFAGELFDTLDPYQVTDMKRGSLVNLVNRISKYTVNDVQQVAGEYGKSTAGFVEFHADQEALQRLILQVFYQPVAAK